MIRYICDIDDCAIFADTEDAKLPPGWTVDPIYSDGKYTGKMAHVCASCDTKRRGDKVTVTAIQKPVSEQAVQQSRAKKRKADQDGQRGLF